MGKQTAPSVIDPRAHAAIEKARKARIAKMKSVSHFRTVPGRVSHSTRGEVKETWQTKRWTPHRRRNRADYLERIEKRRQKERAEAEAAVKRDRAKFVEREGGKPVRLSGYYR